MGSRFVTFEEFDCIHCEQHWEFFLLFRRLNRKSRVQFSTFDFWLHDVAHESEFTEDKWFHRGHSWPIVPSKVQEAMKPQNLNFPWEPIVDLIELKVGLKGGWRAQSQHSRFSPRGTGCDSRQSQEFFSWCCWHLLMTLLRTIYSGLSTSIALIYYSLVAS